MREGINTEVRHRGRLYHVQTQTGHRTNAVVETLIYEGGRVVVRMTASFAALSEKWRLPRTESTRLLALQHWDMIHKIKRGMLDGDEPERTPGHDSPPSPRGADRVASSLDPEDPQEREVLADLEAKLERIVNGEDERDP